MKTMQEHSKMKTLRLGALGLAFAMAPMVAWAQAAIRSISASQSAGAEVVRIELTQPLSAVPGGFTVQTPPRIAIDLPGVTSDLPRPSVEINQGNVRSANVAQAGERTRLVLNLKQPANYTAQLEGNALLLVLENTGAVAATTAAASQAGGGTVHFAPSVNTSVQALRGVDFRRGAEGAGRVVVDLPSTQVGVDIRQQGQNLVVEFLKTNLPDNLRRRLDVTDFGTPVQMVSTTQVGDLVRMVVEPRGNWEHSAYQTDTQFVLEVRPQKEDPNRLVQGPTFQGEKLSLNFQNIEVRALLQVIADFTNFNVVTSDSVTGNVTLRLRDVPWDQALEIILQAKGLGYRKAGNVLWIAPKDEIAAKEKMELEAQAQIAQLEPLRTQSFQLNYAKATDVVRSLVGTGGGANASPGGASGAGGMRILTPRGSVIAEPRTNQLFITDVASKLEEVQQLISKIDIPVRQVMIEARIVEADDSFGRQLGVKLGATDLRGLRGGVPGWGVGGSNRIGIGGNYLGIGEQTLQAQVTSGSYIPNSYFVNMPAQAIDTVNPATLALSLFSSAANRFLNLEISALEADGKGRVVSSPRVITADQVTALIEQGTELPYQNATSSGATSVEFRKASLKLEVKPQITPEGGIILDVDVNKDTPGILTPGGYAIDTKHVKTQVLVENGGTVVIGGIFTMSEREDVNKVPLLGDIPVLGYLFKQRGKSTSKTELLVFLTPRIVSERGGVR